VMAMLTTMECGVPGVPDMSRQASWLCQGEQAVHAAREGAGAVDERPAALAADAKWLAHIGSFMAATERRDNGMVA